MRVQVVTELEGATYAAFVQIADDRGTTVAALLAMLADQALAPARAHRARRVRESRPRRHYRHWTPEEDAHLAELHAAGLSDGAIAVELDRSQAMISRKRTDAGLAPHFAAPVRR